MRRWNKGFIILGLAICYIALSSCGSSETTTPQTVDYSSSLWQLSQPQPNTLLGIWGNSENDVFVVGDKGTILRYDGEAWNIMDSGTIEALSGVWGTSPADVFAVGDSGTILHYDGISWNSMNSGTMNHLRDIWGGQHPIFLSWGSTGLFYITMVKHGIQYS